MKAVAAFFRASAATRAQALEALLLLLLARLLVAHVPMRRWRRLLNTSVAAARGDGGAGGARSDGEPAGADTPGLERRGGFAAMGSRDVAGRRDEQAEARERARAMRTARRVTGIVRKVTAHAPFRAVCLPRAMAAQWMLRRRGVRSRLDFGVRRSEDDTLEFHAWLSVAGETVMGGREAGRYTGFAHAGGAVERPGRTGNPDRTPAGFGDRGEAAARRSGRAMRG